MQSAAMALAGLSFGCMLSSAILSDRLMSTVFFRVSLACAILSVSLLLRAAVP